MLVDILVFFVILFGICLSAPVAMALIYGILRLIPAARKIMVAPTTAHADGAA